MDNSEIWDAENGILSTDGGKFNVTNSVFDGNFNGIFLDNYISATLPGYVSGTTFKSSHQLLHPHVNSLARSGIHLDTVMGDYYRRFSHVFTIGDTLVG